MGDGRAPRSREPLSARRRARVLSRRRRRPAARRDLARLFQARHRFPDFRRIQVAERAVRLRTVLRAPPCARARAADPARRYPRARRAALGLGCLLRFPRHEASSRAPASGDRAPLRGTGYAEPARRRGARRRASPPEPNGTPCGRFSYSRSRRRAHRRAPCARARVWTPREPRSRAGIVTFTLAARSAADERLRAFLERRAIFTSARYCSGVGGVRVAIHLFNTRRDVYALLAAVDGFRL